MAHDKYILFPCSYLSQNSLVWFAFNMYFVFKSEKTSFSSTALLVVFNHMDLKILFCCFKLNSLCLIALHLEEIF